MADIKVFDAVKVCVFAYCIIDMIYCKVKPDKFVLSVFVFEFYMLCITLLRSANMFTIIKQMVVISSTAYLICRLGKQNFWLLIRTMSVMFNVYMLINTITVFMFPGAMYLTNRGKPECWFLGLDNTAIVYYIIGNILSAVYNIRRKKPLWIFISFLQTFLFVFKNDIATGKVCLIVMILMIGLSYIFKKLFSKINVLRLSIVDAVLMIMVVFLNTSAFSRILL